jgi:hypothetical protein
MVNRWGKQSSSFRGDSGVLITVKETVHHEKSLIIEYECEHVVCVEKANIRSIGGITLQSKKNE